MIKNGIYNNVYYMLPQNSEHRLLDSRSSIIRRYIGWPHKYEKMLIMTMVPELDTIFDILQKGLKESKRVKLRFPVIYELVNNSLSDKKSDKELLSLSFANNKTPIASIQLPYFRYDRYFINGEAQRLIDETICEIESSLNSAKATCEAYLESRRKWSQKVLMKMRSLFLTRTIDESGLCFLSKFKDYEAGYYFLEEKGTNVLFNNTRLS